MYSSWVSSLSLICPCPKIIYTVQCLSYVVMPESKNALPALVFYNTFKKRCSRNIHLSPFFLSFSLRPPRAPMSLLLETARGEGGRYIRSSSINIGCHKPHFAFHFNNLPTSCNCILSTLPSRMGFFCTPQPAPQPGSWPVPTPLIYRSSCWSACSPGRPAW